MGLVEDLNRISEMQGKTPINPAIIQGEAGPEPPPYSPPEPKVPRDPDVPVEWLDPDLDEGAEPVPSPLIPRRGAADLRATDPLGTMDRMRALGDAVGAQNIAALLDAGAGAQPVKFDLAVGDRMASWRERSVTLTEPEEKAIRAIVLRAIRREVDADLGAIDQPLPRKRRKSPTLATSGNSGAGASTFTPTSTTTTEVVRRRRRARARGEKP